MVTIKSMKAMATRAISWIAAVVGIAAAAPAAASTITYYHNDIAGSPVAATNSAAQVIWRESYRPYGERLTKSASAKSNDVWFTSRREDSSGLVYMGARHYDPVAGRFVSTDPKRFDESNVQSFNRYAYANNNPYKFVDRDGREPGSIYQRGYALPIPRFDREVPLEDVRPELYLLPFAGSLGAVRTAVAAEEATTTLFRAVSQAEARQIETTGGFEISANSTGGKYFAETAADAASWGTKMEGAGNFSVVEATFPKQVADSFMRWNRLDGIGPARFGEIDAIQEASPTIRLVK